MSVSPPSTARRSLSLFLLPACASALALLILGGTVIYFIISHVLNAFRLSELKSAVKRGG